MTKNELAKKIEAFLLTLDPHDKDDYYATDRARASDVMVRFCGFIDLKEGVPMCEAHLD